MNEWTIDELRTGVAAYMMMLSAHKAERTINKAAIYRALAASSQRTAKSWEYRMQNISHVLATRDQQWIPGLKPAGNVGRRVLAMIEQCLDETPLQLSPAANRELWIALEKLANQPEARA